MLYDWYDSGDCSSFTNSSPNIDPLYLIQWLRTLIRQSKGFYSTALWSSLWVPRPTGPFHIILLSQQWLLGSSSAIQASFTESSLHSECWHIFLLYWLSCSMMFGAVSLLSSTLVTLMKLFSAYLKQVVYQARSNSTQCCLMCVQLVYNVTFGKCFVYTHYYRRKIPSNQFFKRYLVIIKSKLLRKICI